MISEIILAVILVVWVVLLAYTILDLINTKHDIRDLELESKILGYMKTHFMILESRLEGKCTKRKR